MENKNNIRIAVAVLAVSAAVAFAGAGCGSIADQAANDALAPVSTSFGALQKAQGLSIEEKARVAREADSLTNDITVAMILIEGGETPSGIETGDEIGCGDHIAYARASRETATDPVVRDALNTLFSLHETTVQGLHNSLAFSSLLVEDIRSTDGVTTEVWLKGDLVSAGSCDDPRLKAQIEHTIKHYQPTYKIFLNGSEAQWRCFGDMSGTCK